MALSVFATKNWAAISQMAGTPEPDGDSFEGEFSLDRRSTELVIVLNKEAALVPRVDCG
jgi:hypothetical protein